MLKILLSCGVVFINMELEFLMVDVNVNVNMLWTVNVNVLMVDVELESERVSCLTVSACSLAGNDYVHPSRNCYLKIYLWLSFYFN